MAVSWLINWADPNHLLSGGPSRFNPFAALAVFNAVISGCEKARHLSGFFFGGERFHVKAHTGVLGNGFAR